MQKKFAQKLNEHNKYSKTLVDVTNELMELSKIELERGNVEGAERIAEIAEKCTALMVDVSNTFEDEHKEELQLLTEVVTQSREVQPEAELYLNTDEQKIRRIAFAHCEDEEGCGFLVEFKHPNCTFFFCKDHGAAINLDLKDVPAAGVECPQHGAMERYDLVKDDNVCPKCESTTLAILSVPRTENDPV